MSSEFKGNSAISLDVVTRNRFPKPWVGGSNPSRPTILKDLANHRATVFGLFENRRIPGSRSFLLPKTKDQRQKSGAPRAEVHMGCTFAPGSKVRKNVSGRRRGVFDQTSKGEFRTVGLFCSPVPLAAHRGAGRGCTCIRIVGPPEFSSAGQSLATSNVPLRPSTA